MTERHRAKVVLATQNPGKVREFSRLLGDGLAIEFQTVSEVAGEGFFVEETGSSFAANAELKARAASEFSGSVSLADDSGLEVDALGGAPGVRSARYAGDDASDAANNERLLSALGGTTARRARFRCVLALFDPETAQVHFSEGSSEGSIALAPSGAGGFGYDPIFLPDGFDGLSFAELSAEQKDAVSHRGRALRAMRQILTEVLTGR